MGMLEGMETADDIPQEVLDRESRLKRLVEQFGTLEGFMTQEELQRLREEPLIERQPKAKNGPADFWQAFEDFPADFERPAPVAQSSDPAL
jgi:hypothetical protein